MTDSFIESHIPTYERFLRLFRLALPIIAAMLSQNLFNLVDTLMVGVLGDAALAAVGIGGFTMFLSSAVVIGLSVGVQAIVSQRRGERKDNEIGEALHAGLILAISIGCLLAAVVYFLIPSLFPFLNQDPLVIQNGVPYLQARALAIPFIGINTAYRGFWNGIHYSSIYLRSVLIMHAANIFLNFILIFGYLGCPALGVLGSGIGTALATVIGALVHTFFAFKLGQPYQFLKVAPRISNIKSILKIGLPSGFQNVFFAAGFLVFYLIIGRIGTKELAASNVITNVMLVAILPGIGMGTAAASFVGFALGEKNMKEAFLWGWHSALIAAVFLGLIGLPAVLVPHTICATFIHAPDTLNIAVTPMRLMGLFMFNEGLLHVLMHSLQTVGEAKKTLIINTLLQWGLVLPLSYYLGPISEGGLLTVWGLYWAYRCIYSIFLAFLWQKKKWVLKPTKN